MSEHNEIKENRLNRDKATIKDLQQEVASRDKLIAQMQQDKEQVTKDH